MYYYYFYVLGGAGGRRCYTVFICQQAGSSIETEVSCCWCCHPLMSTRCVRTRISEEGGHCSFSFLPSFLPSFLSSFPAAGVNEILWRGRSCTRTHTHSRTHTHTRAPPAANPLAPVVLRYSLIFFSGTTSWSKICAEE